MSGMDVRLLLSGRSRGEIGIFARTSPDVVEERFLSLCRVSFPDRMKPLLGGGGFPSNIALSCFCAAGG
jgi:hypothetical protein